MYRKNKCFRAVLLVFSVVVAGLSAACAPKMPPMQLEMRTGYDRLEEPSPEVEVVVSDELEFGDAVTERYEAAPIELDGAPPVPADLAEGPNHRVRSVRLDHRFLYTYEIETSFGDLEVVGRGLLRKRVMEVDALAQAPPSWLGGTRLYAVAVANAASDPIEAALQIVRHPVRTTTNIPRSLVTSFKAMREMARFNRTHLEDDYYQEFMGLSGRKREWALRMGVDPYTTNPLVQKRLSRNGVLSLAGNMTARLATIPITAGAASIAMSVAGATSGMSSQLRDIAPEDIRVDTREWLRDELGVEGELAESFLEHPWYSPSRQKKIVDALSRMEGTANRERFIEMASYANEPHEAYAFSRLALMLAEFHERSAPIAEIFTTQGLLAGRTHDGDSVVPLYMDFGYWTEQVDHTERDIRAELDPVEDEGRWSVDLDESREPERVLLISGHLSPRATAELRTRGWEIVPQLEELWLASLDQQRFQPRSPSAGRILPEIPH